MKILVIALNTKIDKKMSDVTHVRELVCNLSKSNKVLLISQSKKRVQLEGIKLKRVKTINFRYIKVILSMLVGFIIGFCEIFHFKPDLIYERLDAFGISFLLGKIFRIPVVLEINGLSSIDLKMINLKMWWRRIIVFIAEKISFRSASKIITVTQNIKEDIQKNYKISEEKIVVVPNGANIDLFRPIIKANIRTELGLLSQGKYVCFVGNLFPWQGIEYLIKSAPLILEKCPDTRFLIVGDGIMKKELITLAEKTGVSDKFIFTGAVPYEEVPKYINASDICVAPFVRARNEKIGLSPLKIYEYLACGKPIASSRIPNLEFIEEQNAGISVEPENPEDLAKAILKLLKDEELRDEMGRNGRDYVVKTHSWESVARRVAEVCKSAIIEHKNKK